MFSISRNLGKAQNLTIPFHLYLSALNPIIPSQFENKKGNYRWFPIHRRADAISTQTKKKKKIGSLETKNKKLKKKFLINAFITKKKQFFF